MTVITAVKKGNEIAIACDSLTANSSYRLQYQAEYKVNDRKLLTFGNSILGLSGTLAVHQIFEDLLANTEVVEFSSRQDIFRWLLSKQETFKSTYFLKPDVSNNKSQVTETNWLSVLIANPHGIFSISGYREVIEYSKFWAIGSGGNFALGAMEVLYEQDLTASEIAEAGATAATKFNPGCAPPIYVENVKTANRKKGQKRPQSKS